LGGCGEGTAGDAFFFDEVKPDISIYREEIFGPVLSVVRVPDLATAIAHC
jgi:malonate-semialdehyde dehydrogenase (acetylating)/methylmalonate-semialdehyde dehydrogenase